MANKAFSRVVFTGLVLAGAALAASASAKETPHLVVHDKMFDIDHLSGLKSASDVLTPTGTALNHKADHKPLNVTISGHDEMAVKEIEKFGNTNLPKVDIVYKNAAGEVLLDVQLTDATIDGLWFHDTKEDMRVSYREIKLISGKGHTQEMDDWINRSQ